MLKLVVEPVVEEHTDNLTDYWMRDPLSSSQFGPQDKNEDYAKLALEASMAVYQQQAHVAKLVGCEKYLIHSPVSNEYGPHRNIRKYVVLLLQRRICWLSE